MGFIFLLIAVSFLTIRQLRNKVGWQQALPKFSTKSIHLEMLLPLIIFCTSLIDASVMSLVPPFTPGLLSKCLPGFLHIMREE